MSKLLLRIYNKLSWIFRTKLNPLAFFHSLFPFKIPIIIISFNQLFYLKKLVKKLLEDGFKNIIIIDNHSTYLPLLNYFDELNDKTEITIIKNKHNQGHKTLWYSAEILKKYCRGYYVVTDPDVVPLDTVPQDYLRVMLDTLKTNPRYTKVGFSLNLTTIPNFYEFKTHVLSWESRFWKHKIGDNYDADIDTTFALYQPGYRLNQGNFFKAIRLAPPYEALHGGWYINYDKLTDEQQYYMKTASSSSSWNKNSQGKTKYH